MRSRNEGLRRNASCDGKFKLFGHSRICLVDPSLRARVSQLYNNPESGASLFSQSRGTLCEIVVMITSSKFRTNNKPAFDTFHRERFQLAPGVGKQERLSHSSCVDTRLSRSRAALGEELSIYLKPTIPFRDTREIRF